MTKTTAADINTFWLDEIGPDRWFTGGDEVDQMIRDRFRADWENAETLVEKWKGTPEGALAAMILIDQFPRNIFREDPRAFATDPLALELAAEVIEKGFDMQIEPPQRNFFYLPYVHSEELADQDRGVELIEERVGGMHLHHAILHRDAIRAFGRFPWRNKALGRVSTEAEEKLMEAGGYGALVSGKVSLAAE